MRVRLRIIFVCWRSARVEHVDEEEVEESAVLPALEPLSPSNSAEDDGHELCLIYLLFSSFPRHQSRKIESNNALVRHRKFKKTRTSHESVDHGNLFYCLFEEEEVKENKFFTPYTRQNDSQVRKRG